MNYKTILVHIDSGNRCATRVDVAIRLAIQHEAHLVALYALVPFVLPGYLIAQAGREVIETQKNAAVKEMARAEAAFTKQSSNAGLSDIEWRSSLNDPVDAMAMHARYADLVVIGQSDPANDSGTALDFPERMVLSSGRPVLILPNIGSFPTIGKRVLIAWNASHEATRAVTDAIPLLRLADNVNVMAINPEHGVHGSVPGAEIALYLARHGVHIEVKTDHGAGIDVGNEILSRAADFAADLIVMGGYGHSRLKEWVLGGATRTLLESMTVPVLMSH
jgi:nucleotide-binding universal stress UspA family protein